MPGTALIGSNEGALTQMKHSSIACKQVRRCPSSEKHSSEERVMTINEWIHLHTRAGPLNNALMLVMRRHFDSHAAVSKVLPVALPPSKTLNTR